LFNRARQTGKPSFHVEDCRQLDLREMKKYRVIGLTAGSSTPPWIIQKIASALENA
jgi:4-hydroxy-3-methylbut-2-enyl diphosphate reductase